MGKERELPMHGNTYARKHVCDLEEEIKYESFVLLVAFRAVKFILILCFDFVLSQLRQYESSAIEQVT